MKRVGNFAFAVLIACGAFTLLQNEAFAAKKKNKVAKYAPHYATQSQINALKSEMTAGYAELATIVTNNNITGAQGPKGDPGPQGPAGPAGAIGENGLVDFKSMCHMVKEHSLSTKKDKINWEFKPCNPMTEVLVTYGYGTYFMSQGQPTEKAKVGQIGTVELLTADASSPAAGLPIGLYMLFDPQGDTSQKPIAIVASAMCCQLNAQNG